MDWYRKSQAEDDFGLQEIIEEAVRQDSWDEHVKSANAVERMALESLAGILGSQKIPLHVAEWVKMVSFTSTENGMPSTGTIDSISTVAALCTVAEQTGLMWVRPSPGDIANTYWPLVQAISVLRGKNVVVKPGDLVRAVSSWKALKPHVNDRHPPEKNAGLMEEWMVANP